MRRLQFHSHKFNVGSIALIFSVSVFFLSIGRAVAESDQSIESPYRVCSDQLGGRSALTKMWSETFFNQSEQALKELFLGLNIQIKKIQYSNDSDDFFETEYDPFNTFYSGLGRRISDGSFVGEFPKKIRTLTVTFLDNVKRSFFLVVDFDELGASTADKVQYSTYARLDSSGVVYCEVFLREDFNLYLQNAVTQVRLNIDLAIKSRHLRVGVDLGQ